MKTVAVIPVKGRHPLLRYTIRRLYEKNNVAKVICVGDIEDKEICEQERAEFITHENNPLGKKWNAGFEAARKHNPDVVLFVGSSDWVSDNWLSFIEPFIMDAKVDLIGKPDFYLLDIAHKYRFCHWLGYGAGKREKEPIGIGRVLSKNILDKMNWKPIADNLNNSIDFSMFNNVLLNGGKTFLLKTDEIQSLSISTNRWGNMHKFNDHYSNKLPSKKMDRFEKWLDDKFPEYKLIFK
jgi:hypothetical protein